MEHGATEKQRLEKLTEEIIGAAIEVHRTLGPGLLESSYLRYFAYELRQRSMTCAAEVALPIKYKQVELDCGYRIDLIVDGTVVIELKAVESVVPVHLAQVITYLKLSGKPVGLLINFNVPLLKDEIRRLINPSVTL